MKALQSRDASGWLRAGVFVLFALLPVSMPAHLFVNHFLKRTWCWYSAFLYPEFFVLLALGAVTLRLLRQRETPTATPRRFGLAPFFLTLGSATVVWTCLSAILQGAYADYWIQRLLVGWVFPMCTALVLLVGARQGALRAAWYGLATGVSLLLVVCLSLYVVSFGVPQSFHDLIVVNRTAKAHLGISGGILFGVLTLGNFNDIAVFFAGAIAVCCGAGARPSGGRRYVLSWLVAALILEYLCYSRGVILSLAFLFFLLLVCVFRCRAHSLISPSILLLSFLIASVVPKGAWGYWKMQLTVAAGSTAKFRADLWASVLNIDPGDRRFEGQIPAAASEASARLMLGSRSNTGARKESAEQAPVVSRPQIADDFRALRRRVAEKCGSPRRVFWLGYGSGNNGLIEGMTYDAGTHNLLLDALGASGVVGLVLIVAFWGGLLVATARVCFAGPLQALLPGTNVITGLGLFAVSSSLLVNACMVNWRVDNLGTSLNGTVLWLLVATVCEASRAYALSSEGSSA